MGPDGTGYATVDNCALTTGAPAPSAPGGGFRLHVRDLATGECWRPGNPAGGRDFPLTRHENGVFSLEQRLGGIEARLEACVVPGRRAELRRLRLANPGAAERRLDVTSLVEVALNDPAAHAAHPGFSKLFVQTEAEPARGLLLARRRPRSPDEQWPLLAHAVSGADGLQWETDRLRWQGRGRPGEEPAALAPGAVLSGTTGNVLDPVASLRCAVTLAPGAATTVTFGLAAAGSRDEALALAELVRDEAAVAAAFAAAVAAGQAEPAPGDRGLDVDARDLAAAILAGEPRLRAGAALPAGADPAAVLAQLGMSTATPLVVIAADAAPAVAARVAELHGFWRELGLPIAVAAAARGGAHVVDAGGRRRTVDLDEGALAALPACAHLCVRAGLPAPPPPEGDAPVAPAAPAPRLAPAPAAPEELRFFNGFGGFSADGREYVIRPDAGADGLPAATPLPWTNVIANERFGCIASEAAIGSSWCDNSRENRVTPWSNDPVLDPASELFLAHDEATGAVVPCLPGPRPGPADEVRHGFGYTTWRRRAEDLDLETTLFVDRELPVRLVRVRVTNLGPSPRRLALSAATRLEMGGLPAHGGRFTVVTADPQAPVLLARNPALGRFAGHVTFATVVTDAPGAATSADGRPGRGGEPTLALQASLALAPGAAATVCFLLGQERGEDGARARLRGLATPAACEESWQQARGFWREGLDALGVQTPSPALDLMLGGWLGYQTLSCRMRGRSAFYQSGGAFGYRDQLQDSLALLPYWPDLTRRQVVLHAGHQFREGDVLHWWHPPLEAGIRTRFADDLLWLPYVACEYARQTGDWAVFDEVAPYLSAPALPEGEDEVFVWATPSGEQGPVFEHCCRALDRSLKVGAHGLPLFGTGDWNDGMNRVGRQGRGESTWMGFFLVSIIDAFAPLCERRGDRERAARYRAHRERLAAALNEGGWDGQWYRRGYYDDGAPLGSRENRECRIDALAQAWSVLSKVAPPARAGAVMDEVEQQLINDDERLVRLLTPPFVDTPRDPGYIRGYVAGVRENGGQYTHAATWVVRAMAELGRRDRAAALLDLLNPVLQATTPAQCARYKVEPYVVAADVYGAAPHVGRGGWTWYTGSSGWLQRVALESVLGLRLDEGGMLVVAPCVPDTWPGFTVHWRLPGDGTRYEVIVVNPDGCSECVVAASIDGREFAPCSGSARLPLQRDGGRHVVHVTLGAGKARP